MFYSIIIPIFNEKRTLKKLLKEIKLFYDKGNEIIIVDDGSDDGSKLILSRYNFIKKIYLKKNYGKGIAIKIGIFYSKNNKIITYDGDLELKTDEISKLMILDKRKKVHTVFGIRSKFFNPFFSSHDWGNFIFTTFFNFINMTNHKDILCCAKAFFKDDLNSKVLKSNSFDIDVEILTILLKTNKYTNCKQVLLNYDRRSLEDGKKLKIRDGFLILKRILMTI